MTTDNWYIQEAKRRYYFTPYSLSGKRSQGNLSSRKELQNVIDSTIEDPDNENRLIVLVQGVRYSILAYAWLGYLDTAFFLDFDINKYEKLILLDGGTINKTNNKRGDNG